LWVAVVADKRAEGNLPLDEIRLRIEREVRSHKKADVVARKLEDVRAKISAGASLEEAAGSADLEVRKPAAFTRAESVSGIGRGNSVIAAAFRLDAGALSEVLTLRQGAYLLRLVEKVSIDEEQFATESVQLNQQLLAQRQQEALQNWLAQIYDAAEIEDNRHLFFTF
jgi:hypothetical protein